MPSIFPATYSTLSADALASLIAKQYEIENISCKLLLAGVGDTYLAEAATARYILRVYRSSHRTKDHVIAETQLLLALHKAEVPVSYPIADKDGSVIQLINAAEGERCAVLFSYAPGASVSILSEQQLHELGWQMARFHNISATINLEGSRWTYDEETTLVRPLEMLRPYLLNDPDTFSWLQQAVEHVKNGIARLNTSQFPGGYIHYDMMPKNFHFDGNKITFFDFDFMGYGWLINDLMTFRQQLSLDVHFGKITQEAADNSFSIVLDGYQAIRSISREELAAIPYLSPGFWMFYSAFHTTHDQFSQIVQPSHLKARFAIVRKMLEKQLTELA